MKNSAYSYVEGISKRHNMSADERSIGRHAELPKGHPLATPADCQMPSCTTRSPSAGGRMDKLPASNESVSSRSGPSYRS